MIRIFRIVTVPVSFEKLLTGQMQFMQQHGCKVIMISSNLAKLAKVSNEEGCDYFAISMTRRITPFKDARALYKLFRLMRQHQPNIVHTHTPKAGILGMLAGLLAGVKVRMHTVAGLPLMEARGLKRAVLATVERITYLCATRIYPNSIKLSGYLQRHHFCKPQKLKVLGQGSSNGIDVEYFSIDENILLEKGVLANRYGIGPGNFVYVFVGRMVADKGINELVKAFLNLYAQHNALRLLLVGPFEDELDPLKNDTKTAIRDCPGILHVGYQHDVRPWLALAQVLVFPSYREGFPNVPMQAGCFNLPCIVTDINGCNEIIIDGVNGLIVEPKNTHMLQQAMERMYTDANFVKSCAKNARDIIVSSYNNKLIWHEMLREYRTLAGVEVKRGAYV